MRFTLLLFVSFATFVSSLNPGVILCSQCKFFKKDPLNKTYGKCGKFPVIVQDALVRTPTLKTEHTYCAIARSYDHLCGPKGKYYEPN